MALVGSSDSGARVDASWASCLVLVVAYDDVAPAVAHAAEDAQLRLATSPALADFIELRFTPLGERPDEGGADDDAVARIAAELASPTRGAPENFLALVVVDDLAADAARLLACARSAFAELPFAVHQAAFAVDDGGRRRAVDDPSLQPNILGFGPRLESRLTDALLDVCDELMRDPHVTAFTGVTNEVLRAALIPEGDNQTLAGLSAEAPPPVELAESPSAAEAPVNVNGKPAETAAEEPVGAPVFVAALDTGSGRDADRAREIIARLDAHLAAESDASAGLVFEVALAAPGSPLSVLRPAGRLQRSDLRASGDLSDASAHLVDLTAAIVATRDDPAHRGRLVTRPSVVLVTFDPPLADPVSRAAFDRLTQHATVIWVLVGDAAWLLSPAYRKGAAVVSDGDRVIEDVFDGVLMATARSSSATATAESRAERPNGAGSPMPKEGLEPPTRGL